MQVENSYKLLSHVPKDMSFTMTYSKGRNEETGGIYPERDTSYVVGKQYNSFVKVFTDMASSSLKK